MGVSKVAEQRPLIEGTATIYITGRRLEEGMSVPDMVRELAREKGWSLGELARRCNIPEGSLRNLAYGKSDNPTLDTLVKLAAGTGKPLEDIIRMLGYVKVA